MEILMAILASILFATAIYNLLQKQFLRIIIGTVLLSHAAPSIFAYDGKIKTRKSSCIG